MLCSLVAYSTSVSMYRTNLISWLANHHAAVLSRNNADYIFNTHSLNMYTIGEHMSTVDPTQRN